MKSRAIILAFPLTLFPTGGRAQSTPQPLSKTEILGRMALSEPSSYVGHLVKIRGIAFQINQDFLHRVRLAGGAGILIDRLSAASAALSTRFQPDPPIDHLTQCAEAQHLGDSERAATECRASIEENSQSPWPILAAIDAAVHVENDSDFPDAEKLKLMRRAIALAPDVAETHASLAKLLSNEKERLSEFAKAHSLDEPDAINARPSAGPMLIHGFVPSGRSQADYTDPHYEEKLDAKFQNLLAIDPDIAATHMYLAHRSYVHQDITNSLIECGTALRLEPDNPGLHAITAEYYESNSDFTGQISELREAVRLAPFNSYLRQLLVHLLEESGRQEEAIREWLELIFVSPRDVQASQALVALYLKQNDTDSAIKELQRLLSASLLALPDEEKFSAKCSSSIQQLSELLAEKEEFKQAIEQLTFLLHFDPDSANLHNRLGNVYYQEENWNQASSEYRESLRLEPLSYVHNNLANCLLEENRVSEAIAEFKQSLQLQPNSPSTLNSLAWLYATADSAQFRNSAEALRLAKLAVQYSEAPDPAILDTLAEAQLLNNQAQEALATEQQAAKLDPQNPQIQSRLLRFEQAAKLSPPKIPVQK